MKPLGVLLCIYIAGTIIYFVMDYYKKEDEKRAQEKNNNEKVEE